MLRRLFTAGRRAVQEEDGITAVEYAVLAALVAGGLVLAVPTLNTAVSGAFTQIGTIISPAG